MEQLVKKVIKMVQDLYDVDYSKKINSFLKIIWKVRLVSFFKKYLRMKRVRQIEEKMFSNTEQIVILKRSTKRCFDGCFFCQMTRDSLVKKGSGKKAEAKQLKNAKDVAVQAKEKAEELGFSRNKSKEVGLKTNAKGEALIKTLKMSSGFTQSD